MLNTSRLTLVPWHPEQILALIEDPGSFPARSGHPAAEGLREMFVSDEVSPAWLASLRSSTGPDPWRLGFMVVHRLEVVAIGSVGFVAPPDADGTVEVAYGIAPGYQERGYATEAAEATVAFALGASGVRRVIAHTLPLVNASTRVLEKCGFRLLGAVDTEADGVVWRWERLRSS